MSEKRISVSIDEFVRENAPTSRPVRGSKYDPYLSEMQDLHSRGYALSQICDWLNRNGVNGTAAEVCNFLKRRSKK